MGLFRHFKSYFVRGLVATIPVTLTALAIYILYNAVDRRVGSIFERFLGIHIPGLGILTVLIILYLAGLIISNTLGRQTMRFVEKLSARIPLIKTTYKIGQQLTKTLSLPENQIFKQAILVEYLKPGMWTIGFITGTLVDHDRGGTTYLKVFIPTPPNPTSGTMVLVKEENTIDPGWTVTEALETVISAGIIGPGQIRKNDLSHTG
jgi:uncharacterized membrane protein